MKNILFLVYEFPPLNSGGSHRPFKFVKYLKEYGLNPVVVTPEVPAHIQDTSMINELQDVTVIRTHMENSVRFEKLLSKNYINILDTEAKKWKKHLFPVLESLVQKYNFQAMYVTAPPFSIANLGVEVSKKFQLPLILDMRDHWSYWNITPFTSYLHYRAILRTEKKWFQQASVVLAVSEQMVDDFIKLHPDIDRKKFHTIRNAFKEEIKDIPDQISIRKASVDKPLKIGYVGSFYYHPYQRKLIFDPWWKKKPHQWFQYTPKKEDWLYRSPYFFFKTLQKLFKKYPQYKKLVQVEFIGAKPKWLEEMVKEFTLEDNVVLHGFLSHTESILFQQGCDVLLGTSMKVIGGRDYCIAGKSYEYLAQKKPVLAFVTEGTQKDFFEESGMSLVLDADEIDKNVELFKSFMDGEMIFMPNKSFIKKLSAKFSTKELANVIKEVVYNA